MARPNLTILLLTPAMRVRADIVRGRIASVKQDRSAVAAELPTLVDLALKLGGPPARKVWVLSSDLWTQELHVGRSLVAGLADDAIARALAFEAESLSGIGAFDSSVAFRRLGSDDGEESFWITVARASVRGQVEDVLAAAGASLAGLAHPGGLPRALSDGSPSPWVRVELWSDAVFAVAAPGAGKSMAIWGIDPRRAGWEDRAAAWMHSGSGGTHEEVLVASQAATSTLGIETRIDLDTESGLRGFFEGWRIEIGAKAGVPAIFPPPRPMSGRQRTLLAVACTVVALLLCSAHYALVQSQLRHLRGQQKPIAERIEEFRRIEKQLKEARANEQSLDEDVSRVQGGVAALDAQKARLHHLLATLSSEAGDGFVIDRIESHGTVVRLHGVSLDPNGANDLERRLSSELAPHGWTVLPPGKTALMKNERQGPWRFELPLQWAIPATSGTANAAERTS